MYVLLELNPIGSMYGIFTYIYPKKQPNVGKYTIHGWYGNGQYLYLQKHKQTRETDVLLTH